MDENHHQGRGLRRRSLGYRWGYALLSITLIVVGLVWPIIVFALAN